MRPGGELSARVTGGGEEGRLSTTIVPAQPELKSQSVITTGPIDRMWHLCSMQGT